MNNTPEKGEIVYFPGTNTTNFLIGITKKVSIIKSQPRVHLKSIYSGNENKITLGDPENNIAWIGYGSIPWKMSFIVGEDIEEKELIKIFFTRLAT
jgi:hypothetical protein